eukprot:10509224-Lingulodinium_polyedra.AAC.1
MFEPASVGFCRSPAVQTPRAAPRAATTGSTARTMQRRRVNAAVLVAVLGGAPPPSFGQTIWVFADPAGE